MNAWLASRWPRWGSRRFRIAFYAIFFGVLAGLVNLLLPLEDVAINARSALRRQAAPENVVVIGIDDRTLGAISSSDVTRAQDAVVVDMLFQAGAKRMFFDRSYRFEHPELGDRDLVNALDRYKGRVFLPAASSDQDKLGDPLSDLPNRRFREHAGLVGAAGLPHPFNQGVSFPVFWPSITGDVTSISAKIAGRTNADQPFEMPMPFSGMPTGFFRPDYSFDYKTIPTISYLDVLNGRFDPRDVAGKDVVVGGIAKTYKDDKPLPYQGHVAGVYFHVIGSYMFDKPLLAKLGWLPALLAVSLIIVTGLRSRRLFNPDRIAGIVFFLGPLPLVLDVYGIEMEIAPALLVSSIALFRSWSLDRVENASETNLTSGLPNLQQLKTGGIPSRGSLVALKLRNYGAIVASFDSGAEAKLALELARRVRLGDPEAVIYHEGDKFLWISQIMNPADISDHLEGLHRLVQGGLTIDGRDVDLSFNCGVDSANGSQIEKRIANALQSAEQAVRGDELVCIHDPASNEVHWEISLLSELDKAIDSGEVWVAYQAKLDLASGQIRSAEALARWTHPERGPISPEKFIQIAEEYHRIDRITRFVLGEAIRTARRVRHQIPDFTVSVNISAQLLRYAELPEMILGALRAEGMSPDCLMLEITETDRLDRSSKTYAMMEKLVGAGLALSIDDFGTGNATIDYLRFLPAVEVKIDKVFVSSITSDHKDMLLVQSIIEMAHSLDRRVVAEGVENQEIMAALARLGCDEIQGYHISRPLRREDFEELISPQRVSASG